MDGMKVPLAIVMAVAIQAGAMLWYVSGIDHRVSTMYVEYQKSNQKAVIENQVRMEMDLQQVVKAVVGMGQQVIVNKDSIDKLNKQIKQSNNNKKKKKKATTKKLG
tara:strand:- start:454 stop:771 length:318 start_codon:yes stop_codon:yes gene_type:complete